MKLTFPGVDRLMRALRDAGELDPRSRTAPLGEVVVVPLVDAGDDPDGDPVTVTTPRVRT